MEVADGALQRRASPLKGDVFLTDGGLETTLIFHDGIDLPEFAAYPLLATEDGRVTFRGYYRTSLEIARDRGAGFILESMTWRASQGRADKLGHSPKEGDAIYRVDQATDGDPIELGGCCGTDHRHIAQLCDAFAKRA